jgi:hypothetical protein
VHSAVEPFTSHGNLRNYAKAKPFSWVKPAHVGFSSSIFAVQDRILSTAGDAIRAISTNAQYVTLQKYVSHPSFRYQLFSNPTHKSETGSACRCNSLGPIKLSSQSETESSQ